MIDGPRHQFTVWPTAMVDEVNRNRNRFNLGRHLPDARLGAAALQAYIVRHTYRDTWLYPNGRVLPRCPVSFGFTWSLNGGEAAI